MISKILKRKNALDNTAVTHDDDGNSHTVQVIILVNGVILTLILFFFLAFFTDEIIEDEHAYVSDYAAQSFLSVVESLDKSLMNVSDVVVLSDGKQVNLDTQQTSTAANIFDVLWYAKKERNGRWGYDWLFPKGEGSSLFRAFQESDRVVQEAVNYSNEQGYKDGEVFLFRSLLRDRNTGNRLLFLALRRTGLAGEDYVFFGLLNIQNVFEFTFKNSSKYLSIIKLEDESDTEKSWTYNLTSSSSADEKYLKAFLLNVWGHEFKMSLVFNEMHKLYFLRQVPLYFSILGFVVTLLSVLYVRNNQMQASKLQIANKKLENKNMDLRKAVGKSEQLNEILEQSEKENLSIIDAVSDIIFETDIDGHILFLSAAWRKVTGIDAEQLKGTEIFDALHPQDRQAQMDDFQLLIKGQKQAYRSFTRLKTVDGTFRAVEIAVSMIRQDKNNNLRVVGTFTDVEERRRAERALSEAEKKYRTIVENAAGGIYQLTPEGIYLSANPAMARILDYDSPEHILREVKNAYSVIYVNSSDHEAIIKELSEGADFYNHETEIYRANGDRIWVSENIRAVRDDSGNILYFEGSIEDITKRKESEMGLLEAKMNSDLANRAKSEFLANMSHELRTPLNSIIGFSEIIKNEVFGPIEQKSYWEYAKHINESGQNLLKVINEILDISRIEAGNRQLNETKINIGKIAEDCIDMMSSKIENNQMNIINSLDDIPNVRAEELAIKQVLMNLLSNSIKFTPSGGRVTLSYDVDSHGELRISVTDTGIGLEDEQIEKALSPFGQVNNDLDRSESGTGLGLTLVNALMKMHGGRFELLSQKGIGTTATIILPVDRVEVTKDDVQT